MKTTAYTTARVWGYCYFMDKVNKDTRRVARWDKFVPAALVGGVVAGVVTNPFDIVFSRMQVDQLYHAKYRRGYKNFFDGFQKTAAEGALFRGAGANGVKIGALCCSMSHLYDLCKEQSYFFFGPHWINRFWACAVTTILGTVVSLPFDNIRLRLHTMRPLPDGRMPYNNTMDALGKALFYETNPDKQANYSALLAGAYMYWLRLFAICYVSMFLLDFYHHNDFVEEHWTPKRFSFQGGLLFNPMDPWTLVHHKAVIDKAGEEFNDGGAYTAPHKPYIQA